MVAYALAIIVLLTFADGIRSSAFALDQCQLQSRRCMMKCPKTGDARAKCIADCAKAFNKCEEDLSGPG
jgi:hypothetical protein